MLKSMTGFSYKRVAVKNVGEFTVNMRSYNNRFLDINIKTSRGGEQLEKMIYETINDTVVRGRIDVYVSYTPEKEKFAVEIARLRKAKKDIDALKKELRLSDPTSLGAVMSYSQAGAADDEQLDKKVVASAKAALLAATQELIAYKTKQGASIKKDLLGILARLTKMNKEFEDFLKKNVKDIESVSKDVFEEFSLISFYIEQLRVMILAKDGQIGKKLDFLSQELLREVNTLQAKIKDKKVSLQALYFKEEIERIREISNNIE